MRLLHLLLRRLNFPSEHITCSLFLDKSLVLAHFQALARKNQPMANDDVTPVRQQYLDIKKGLSQYHPVLPPGAIFTRPSMKDAEIGDRELDIGLTSARCGQGRARPHSQAIPHHAVENYLARLIERGYHVAICREQVGDHAAQGYLFPRKVVRVVTPGTVTEPGLLPGDLNNYLTAVIFDTSASLNAGSQMAAVSYVDITTGESDRRDPELPLEALRAELTRLHPAEILLPDNQNS